MKQFKTFTVPVFAAGGLILIAANNPVTLLLRDGSKAVVRVVEVQKEGYRIAWDLAGENALGAPTASIVDEANAADLDTLIALANAEKAAYNAMQVDVANVFTRIPAYGSPTSSQNATAEATNLATAQALVNALKVNYNALQVDLAEVYTAKPELGAITSVQEATTNGSDLATSITLANSLKLKLNTAQADTIELYQFADQAPWIPRSEDVIGVDAIHNDQRP